MAKCLYRENKDCMSQDRCQDAILCLMGQQTDELSLLNSSIANLTASLEESKMEAIHKEEYE